MSEIRQDPTTKQWVIIARERARRPHDFARQQPAKPQPPSFLPTCPFCPGNEAMTPDEVLAYRDQNTMTGRCESLPTNSQHSNLRTMPQEKIKTGFSCA